MSYSMDKVSVNGIQLNLRRSGKGRPIIFLHGAGGVVDWLPFFDQLAKLGELWVPDHPGFGKSDNPPSIKSIPDMAMFYLDFLENVGPAEGFDVVGHSLGGWIAAEIAIRNASKMRSLSLISAAGIRVVGQPMGDPFIWNEEESARNFYYGPEWQQRRLTAQYSGETTDEMIRNKYSFAKHAWHPRLFNPDLEKWLHRIKVPSQVIWGKEDKLIPSSYAEVWGRKIGASQVTVIPECGHHPTIEKSDEVAARIAMFLEQESA